MKDITKFLIEMLNEGKLNESNETVKDEKSFREYAEAKLKEIHGDDYDEAKAKEIELVYGAIKNANPDDRLVAIKSLEALERVAEGDANKIFIPFDATKTLAGIGSIKDVLKD